jgi:sugar phosphate isomerase/epimerase
MTTPISVQLYSLRREAEHDFGAVLERLAHIGFAGVETAGLHGMDPGVFAKRVADLGLVVSSAHVPLPLGADAARVLDEQEAVGNTLVISGLGPDDFATDAAIAGSAERFTEAAENARQRGMTLGYHNHWWEFTPSAGAENPMARFVELVDPSVFLEVDTYWLQASGRDPAATLRELGARVRLLHVKDGPCTQGDPMVAVGQGNVDVAAVLAAAPSAEWHIVELDECATDMFEAVHASYDFLVGAGLSRGRVA